MDHYTLNPFTEIHNEVFMPVYCAGSNKGYVSNENLIKQYGIDVYSMLNTSLSLKNTVQELSIKDVDKTVFGFTASIDSHDKCNLDLYFCDNLSEFKIEPVGDNCVEYVATAFDSVENKYILYGMIDDKYYSFYGNEKHEFGSKYATENDSDVCQCAKNLMKYFKDIIVAYNVAKSVANKSIPAKFEFKPIEGICIDTELLVREAVTNIATNTEVNYSALNDYKNDLESWHELFGCSYDNLFNQIKNLETDDLLVVNSDTDSLFWNAVDNQRNKYKNDVSFVINVGFLGSNFISRSESFSEHLTKCMKLDLALRNYLLTNGYN